ncbi:MAG: winged helix-turn-helix domain-containing protein/riboflavin kinase [Archaeoglobaceae archaeon]|nr:winged helix-turn-helix domain-containing protein/riboflavin kinase [Archaeoglobaceae archaeon]MCX8152720.1 winged helix-turn-helix domain-containing protein/riboflavin kinase [Archaeoglobaceae archaeon]MDW8013427.1 winged helix-turn-helix domain-containing protein/riboflavin kinase [Archaeoglobaceae archaeon]
MLEVLKVLAMMNATKKAVKISAKELAEKINQSFQTAARKLKELEEKGLIERILTKDGQFVVVTEKGVQILYKEYLDYKKIFEDFSSVKLCGKVFSGFGEGRYYVSLEGYRKQFIEKLGFDPYPGTLNLKVLKEHMLLKKKLDEGESIIVEGFKTAERSFGDVKVFKCKIRNIDCAVVIPKRTHYPSDVVEVISAYKLRDVLNLKDGDIVELEVFL